jgi:2-C-methyl-D-erythritol 2,4-cyclodiphosphate synthase
MKVGLGYDVHRLVEGRPLILGGVTIPYVKGLLGHSDADVLLHAIGDAVLGAIGMGDLGKHFPDIDNKYKGISSLIILKNIQEMADQKGFYCSNVDAVIIAQKPKLSKYLDRMRANIAKYLKVEKDKVNIKATTTEGLGFEGRQEGISAQAAVLMEKV